MARITITDDDGNVDTIICVDNCVDGGEGLPVSHDKDCYDGKRIAAGAGLARHGLMAGILESLARVRSAELHTKRPSDAGHVV